MADGIDLRGLMTLMREFGCLKLRTADGTEIVLDPQPQRASVAPLAVDDDPLEAEAKTEEARAERQDRELRKAWAEHWTRMLRSSGSPVPAYPGPEAAQRALTRFAQ